MSGQSPWLTVPEGAAYVRMGRTEFTAKVNRGEIPSYQRSKRARFVDSRELDMLMRSLPSGARVPEAARPESS